MKMTEAERTEYDRITKDAEQTSLFGTVYGYARISRPTQSIERQIRNIRAEYPGALIIQEAYTGTKMDRPEWLKVYKKAKAGDVIVFDSVSRMSRNAEEGFAVYQELFDRGVDLVFLKERLIDTKTIKSKLNTHINKVETGNATNDKMINGILEILREYTNDLVYEQIKIAFNQAQKEVDDLHERTAEGIKTARLNGKQIGTKKGAKFITKKSIQAKKDIQRLSKDFGGSLQDMDVMKNTGLSRCTYYKYKKELKEGAAV